jgi:hypothetical protein
LNTEPRPREGGAEGADTPATFILGRDYHLGDLLWLTAVLRLYRAVCSPSALDVCLPNRDISRILENNPLIDRLHYGTASVGENRGGPHAVHDLRVLPLAKSMVRNWRYRLPVLYYRDLWLQPRGQWLATHLHLGRIENHRPVLHLRKEDHVPSFENGKPYALLAPAIGSYSAPLVGTAWRAIKTWDDSNWRELATRIRGLGVEPLTLSGANGPSIEGTAAIRGLPIRRAAAVVGGAQALISVESGLWFVAAALGTPFIIVPWWLPRRVDWAAPMGVPYRLIRREAASVDTVLSAFRALTANEG